MTAVEFIVQEINKLTGLTISMDEPCVLQAKEMEKEQIVNAHYQGYRSDIGTTEVSEQYYNEKFKSESFCNCPKGKGIDFEENQKAYCIDCGKNIINL